MTGLRKPQPTFFATAADFRAWLVKHHATVLELWVGFRKKSTGRPSIIWPESVDEALCFGWIDGVHKRLDDSSYTIRFTPRKPRSHWSGVNLKRARQLAKAGRMQPAGLRALEERGEERSGAYSYENRNVQFDAASERQFRAAKKAWAYFQSEAPWYRRTATFWVMSAKKEETRQRRLSTLIADSERGQRVPPLRRPGEG